MTENMTLGQIVDALGDIKAEIATLTEREATLKRGLRASRRKVVEGERYRATISRGQAWTADTEKLKRKIESLKLRWQDYCRRRTSVRINVVARTRTS